MSDESNVLDQLISRVADDSLRVQLAHEVDLLRDSRRFGLVFDRHLPESVRLPDHPIRKGIRVALRDESSAETWIVERFVDRTREVAILSGHGGERHVSELIVVREFGEPVYPGLRSVERIESGPAEGPWHVVINGENFHALQALRSTHRGKVDLIYIDPPYNTGNDGWIYNDRYVDQNDRAKSSKWLSFMERRLLIALDLLAPTGVIIAAIGDDEHHRLRMLLDQVFGSSNFIMNVVWQGGGSSLARHHAGGVDYMLVYGRDAERVSRFMDPKPFVPEMLQLVSDALARGCTPDEAQEALRGFIAANKKRMPEGVTRFNNVDANGMVFETADLTNRLPRPNLRYVVHDPESGVDYEPPSNGWTVKKETMDEWVASGMIAFGKRPRRKKSLAEYAQSMPTPAFVHSRNTANAHLQKVLGDKRFPFPKDHEVLMRWFRMAAPKDAVIVDYFGGSGTTSEAVMRLNLEVRTSTVNPSHKQRDRRRGSEEASQVGTSSRRRGMGESRDISECLQAAYLDCGDRRAAGRLGVFGRHLRQCGDVRPNLPRPRHGATRPRLRVRGAADVARRRGSRSPHRRRLR